MSDKESGSNFLVGFIIGAIAGVAIGFLYAPKSGRETRALLKQKASDVSGRIKGAAKEAEKRVREKLSPGEK
jgi:gas vesicle protein